MSDITSLFISKKAEHFPDEPQKQSERDKTAPGKTSRKKQGRGVTFCPREASNGVETNIKTHEK